MTAPQFFPANSSVLAADALTDLLLAHFSLPQPIHCSFFLNGVTHTYRVSSGNPAQTAYLRVYRSGWNEYTDVAAELAIIDTLAQAGVSVATPVARIDGCLITEISAVEGLRYAVLFREAPGVPLDADDVAHCCECGRLIARMHTTLDQNSHSYQRRTMDSAYLIDRPLQLIEPFLRQRPDEYAWLLAISQRLKQALDRLPTTAPAFGVCHGDLQAKNMHIDVSGQITLFDFDHCGYGWRVYDLISLYYQWRQEHPQAWEQVFNAYLQERPLSQEERAAVPLLLAIYHLWALGFDVEIFAPIFGAAYIPELLSSKIQSLRAMIAEYALG
jgi:Ser/Thr protein kinase RdoA (MazF antagonist)